jgi:hypothetical protein
VWVCGCVCVYIPLGGHILAGHVDDTRGQLGVFSLELIMYHCNSDRRRGIRPHHLPQLRISLSVFPKHSLSRCLSLGFSLIFTHSQ